MNRCRTPTADMRAAYAALARLSALDLGHDRILLVDDSDEDMTQLITVLTERPCPMHTASLEVQS